jgi:hypothetical protein
VVSGLPSTLHAVLTGRPLTASVRAAGTLLGRPTIVRGALAHAVISAFWSAVLVPALPERRRLAAGLAAGAAIHVLDLEVIGRRIPAMRALPRPAQLADHLAFGALVAVTSSRSGGRVGARAGTSAACARLRRRASGRRSPA